MIMDDSFRATDEAQTTMDSRTVRTEDTTSAPAPSSLPPPAPAAPDEKTPEGMSRHVFAAMGTMVTVLAPAEQPLRAFETVRALFAEWERALSRFLPES